MSSIICLTMAVSGGPYSGRGLVTLRVVDLGIAVGRLFLRKPGLSPHTVSRSQGTETTGLASSDLRSPPPSIVQAPPKDYMQGFRELGEGG